MVRLVISNAPYKIRDRTFIEGDTIVIDCEDNALTFKKKDPINLPEPQALVSN